MVGESFIMRWADRLRREISDAVAVILKGSHARGEPTRFSDVDFDVLTGGEAREEYPVFFGRTADGRLVHVSVAVQDLEKWLAASDVPQLWAFGLPSVQATRLLWAADTGLREHLDRPYRIHPPAEPELEDFVADLGKVMHARSSNDDTAVRLAAQSLARLCPSVLRPLNPEARPGTQPEALRLALSFPVAPPGYRDDMLVCMGLSNQTESAAEVARAATRLVTGTLDLLQPHAERLTGDLQPGLGRALADGTLRQYVEQLTEKQG